MVQKKCNIVIKLIVFSNLWLVELVQVVAALVEEGDIGRHC